MYINLDVSKSIKKCPSSSNICRPLSSLTINRPSLRTTMSLGLWKGLLGSATPKNWPASLNNLTACSPVSLTATEPSGNTAKPIGLLSFLITYSDLPNKTFWPETRGGNVNRIAAGLVLMQSWSSWTHPSDPQGALEWASSWTGRDCCCCCCCCCCCRRGSLPQTRWRLAIEVSSKEVFGEVARPRSPCSVQWRTPSSWWTTPTCWISTEAKPRGARELMFTFH